MKKYHFAPTLIIILLVVNGMGALSAGLGFILEPDGSAVGIPTSALQHSPFKDFLIPGMLLFVFNGLSSLLVLLLVARKHSKAPLFITAQGVILLVWITVQVIMLQAVHWLHVTFFLMGLVFLTGVKVFGQNRK